MGGDHRNAVDQQPQGLSGRARPRGEPADRAEEEGVVGDQDTNGWVAEDRIDDGRGHLVTHCCLFDGLGGITELEADRIPRGRLIERRPSVETSEHVGNRAHGGRLGRVTAGGRQEVHATVLRRMVLPYTFAVLGAATLSLRWFDPWHEQIRLPSWSPPRGVLRWGWPLGLTSTVVSAHLIDAQNTSLSVLTASLLWAQTVTALVWVVVFQLRRRARSAFYVICLHWSGVALAAAAVASIDAVAGMVMLPWLAFVTYVGAFNFFVWQLEQHE